VFGEILVLAGRNAKEKRIQTCPSLGVQKDESCHHSSLFQRLFPRFFLKKLSVSTEAAKEFAEK
jgi:hypothetical protein